VWLAKSSEDNTPLVAGNVEEIEAIDHILGEESAPKATLVEYSDFQCPACASYEPLLESIIADYESEGLRFVYRHFPLPSHLNAISAAKASEAAGNQGKFWEMHGLLFENQTTWSGQLPSEVVNTFATYAGQLGLDEDKFKTDFEAEATEERVRRDLLSGQKAGVAGTPTFYLNGVELSARVESEFRAQIEEALKSGKSSEPTGSTTSESEGEQNITASSSLIFSTTTSATSSTQ
jgi:protein-disulfide isomerase